jgi:hypothetical protein
MKRFDAFKRMQGNERYRLNLKEVRVVLVRTDVSEERIASTIRLTRIGERGKTLALFERVSVASFC